MVKTITRTFYALALLAPLMLAGCSNSNATAESNMKRLGLLVVTYVSEHNLTYPDFSTADSIKTDLTPLLTKKQTDEPDGSWSDAIFTDPASGQPFTPNANLARIDAGKVDNVMNVITFYAPDPSGDKRLVGYADGHIEWIDESQWPIKKMGGMVK